MVLHSVDFNGVCVNQFGHTVDHLGTRAIEQSIIDAVKSADFPRFIIPQCRPVKHDAVNGPTEPLSVFEGLAKFAAVNVKFFGDTAYVDASPPHIKPFGNNDFGTKTG